MAQPYEGGVEEGTPLCIDLVPGRARLLRESNLKCPVLELERLSDSLDHPTPEQLRRLSPNAGGNVKRIAVNKSTGEFAAECGVPTETLLERSGIEVDTSKVVHGAIVFERT